METLAAKDHPPTAEFATRLAALKPAREQARVTSLLESALGDYARTIAWVDRFPAVHSAGFASFAAKCATIADETS